MKVSIITINWNNKIGLEQTINSVLSQTFIDYEFIVIDGGSNDGGVDVIEANKDKIHYWISEPDAGIYNAMNKGIYAAQGEYCYFLNSGDVFVSNNVLTDIFKHNVRANFVCGNIIWDEKVKLRKDDGYKNRDWLFSLYDIYSGFLCHQAFLIKKEMFDVYGYYDETLRIMSDWKHFLIAIGIHEEQVQYVDVDIAIYNTDGLSSTIGGKAILEEKQKVAKEELSKQVYDELDRLYYLSRNGFVIDFVHSKNWIHFLFKIFMKICTVFKLTKF